MQKRLITTVVLLALLGLLVRYPVGAWYVLWPLGWGIAYEWAALSACRSTWTRALYASTTTGTALWLSGHLHLGHLYFLLNLSATLWGLQVAYVLMNRKVLTPVAPMWRRLLGFLVLPITLLLASHLLEEQPAFLLAMLVLVALSDSAAYGAGRLFGKRLLAPALSPQKTWEGVWGALCVTLPVGMWVVAPFFQLPLQGWALFFWCLAVVLLGMFGDLIESAYKRMQGVKDSGRCLPGHGGLFDRCDAHLAALPVAAYLSLL